MKERQCFLTSYNLKMKGLTKKLKKYIVEHKLLYFFCIFLLLQHLTCLSYQWNIVDIERKAPGKEPETEKHDLKLIVECWRTFSTMKRLHVHVTFCPCGVHHFYRDSVLGPQRTKQCYAGHMFDVD